MDSSILFSNSQSDTVKTTRFLFENYVKGEDDFASVFEDIFDVSKQLLFGEVSDKETMLFFLKKYYRNDYFIRHKFVKSFLSKKGGVTFFELPLNNSRLDIGYVGDKSVAYEIKTDFDNYSRLSKQINDYSLFFENVYVICPCDKEPAIRNIIPSYCGLIVYSEAYKNTSFTKVKDCSLSPNLSAKMMISLMLKSEKKSYFKETNEKKILGLYSFDQINNVLKKAIKKRLVNKSRVLIEECKSIKTL